MLEIDLDALSALTGEGTTGKRPRAAQPWEVDALIAELRASRKVVEAARATLLTLTPVADYPYAWDVLQGALNEYSLLNVRSEEEK